MFQRRNDSKRLYYAYQSVLIAVDKELPPLRAKSHDPLAVAATADELIVGREKFPQFARRFYDKMRQFFVELLNPWLDDNVLGFLNSSA